MLIDLYTMQDWELNKDGIKAEIRANGSMKGLDILNECEIDRLATLVIKDKGYMDAVVELEADDREDKRTVYYDILWKAIDQCDEYIRIDLNGTFIIVKKLDYKEATLEDEVYFHDVHVTFMDNKAERFDAGDVTVLEEGDYDADTYFTS